MATRQTSPIERTKELLADGFTVTDVDSTDTHLVLVLGRDRVEHTILFDRGQTLRLAEEDILNQTPRPMVA